MKGLSMAHFMHEIKVIERMNAFPLKHIVPDTVLFGTNYLTLNGSDATRDFKMSMPQNITVISFDDSSVFHLLLPAVTAIA